MSARARGRTLVIVIPPSRPREAAFFVGDTLLFGDGEVRLQNDDGTVVFTTPASAAAVERFDRAMLSRIVIREVYKAVAPSLADVDRGVALFAELPASGGLRFEWPFAGLARGADGRPIFMQATPSQLVDLDTDDEPA